MKEISIKIYGWSDLKKWFWTRTPFPEVTFENSPQEVELVIKNEQV